MVATKVGIDMPVIKISKSTIDQLKPAEKPYIAFDMALKGFGVRVMPSGLKSYVIEYRPGAGGRSVAKKRLTIGAVGPKTTPDEARKNAKDLLAGIVKGDDPAAGRRREREMPAFGKFADAMLDEANEMAIARPAEARLRPGSIRNYRSLMRQHLQPTIGATKLDALTTADLIKVHRRVGKTKPATANRCLEFVGSVYKEAARQGLFPAGTNPAIGIPAFKENRRERFLSADEVIRLGEAIREGETIGLPWEIDETKKSKHVPKESRRTAIDSDAAAALRLLIFTGARLREILHAKWSDVDLERGVLVAHGKTGRRPVILPAPAAAIFAELPRRDVYCFPGERSTRENPCPRADLNRPWRAIARRAGLDGVRLHDLRHSFASFAAAGGASLPIIGRLLGHTQPSTTQRYSHLADNPLRAVADRVGDQVAAALGGQPPADVVSIQSKRGA